LSNPKVYNRGSIIAVYHDVFRLKILVNDATAMDVFQSGADGSSNTDRAIRWQLTLLTQNVPQETAVKPFHYHVGTMVSRFPRDSDYARMVKLP
jgi:hypothetical protein